MPKESITSSDPSAKFVAKVGWSNDPAGHVQIGVASDSHRSLVWLLFADPDLPEQDGALARLAGAVEEALAAVKAEHKNDAPAPELGRAILNALDGIGVFSGLWADLDRREVNALIKLLRRARDAAFQRDE